MKPIILSSQQKAVEQWVLEDKGSLELLARAGCGKTFTLLRVIDQIVEHRLGEVAVMAFNKSISEELKQKIELKVKENPRYKFPTVIIGTVHSFGFGAWRKIAPSVKVDDDKVWNLLKSQDLQQETLFHQNNSSTILKLISLAKQSAIGHIGHIMDDNRWLNIWDHHGLEDDLPEDVTSEQIITASQKIYKLSLDLCREVIDYNDMILAPLFYKARFFQKDWVLVDESQDMNEARRALALAMLKPRTGRMIFVGDPAQAIYGFTGADSNSMHLLKVATNAKTLPLTVTRRCPKVVVREAQKFVPDFIAHEDAPEGILRSIEYGDLEKENLGKDDAILCRNTAPLIQTAYLLISKGIACRVEGREIGTGLIKLARRWKLKTLDQLLSKLEDFQARETAKFMSKNQEHRVQALVDQLECLRIVINRCLLLKRHSIDHLVSEIEGMFGTTREGENPAVLTLSTGHKSKGREWKRVYLLGRLKFQPSPYARKEWEKQQEENISYVMITRSMNELIDVSAPPENK